MRQKLTDIKGEIDSNTIIVGDFNTSLTPMDSHQNGKLIRKHKSFFFFLGQIRKYCSARGVQRRHSTPGSYDFDDCSNK